MADAAGEAIAAAADYKVRELVPLPVAPLHELLLGAVSIASAFFSNTKIKRGRAGREVGHFFLNAAWFRA